MNAYDAIFKALCDAQAQRSARSETVNDPVDGYSVPAWVLFERTAVLDTVNTLRAALGHPPIDDQTLVRKAERQAAGHVDYSTKFACYAADLVKAGCEQPQHSQ